MITAHHQSHPSPSIKVGSKPTLIQITNDLIPLLSKILKRQKTDDPFLSDLAYLMMTGRHGLWIYGDDNSMMIMARHPNRENILLLFPPFGDNPVGLIQQALSDPQIPKGTIRFARIPDKTGSTFINDLLHIGYAGTIIEEDVLDWTYPVHALDVHRVLKHEGLEFRNFRNRLRAAQKISSRTERIVPRFHHNDIMNIASRWATDGRKAGFTHEDLIGPVQESLRLMENPNLNIHGIIVYHNNQPSSYMIWSIPLAHKNIAVPLVRVSIGHMNGLKGTAEYSMFKTMKALAEDRINFMYMGGSETAELDQFKRKLSPVASISLKSACISGL